MTHRTVSFLVSRNSFRVPVDFSYQVWCHHQIYKINVSINKIEWFKIVHKCVHTHTALHLTYSCIVWGNFRIFRPSSCLSCSKFETYTNLFLNFSLINGLKKFHITFMVQVGCTTYSLFKFLRNFRSNISLYEFHRNWIGGLFDSFKPWWKYAMT